jgi:hypothetical protein
MITDKTIAILRKRAKTPEEFEAVRKVEYSLKSYVDAIAYDKKIKKEAKKPRGYESSSGWQMRHKATERTTHTIKSLGAFLREVGNHRSDPLVLYWIMSDPIHHWDYYWGESQVALYFNGDAWRKKYIQKIFFIDEKKK